MISPWPWLVTSGLALLVPVPFLDEFLSRHALRRALELDQPDSEALPAVALDALTADRDSLLLGCLWVALVWPLKKLFKTVFWFLTWKDVLDRTAWSAQVFSNTRIARQRGWLPTHAVAVRDSIDATFEKFRWSPVTRTLLRYDQPALVAPGEGLEGLVNSVRQHAGGALLDAYFTEHARKVIEGGAALPGVG